MLVLPILLLFFIGRNFYVLAKKHQKNSWFFTLLGITTYFFGIYIFRISHNFILQKIGTPYLLEGINRYILGLIAMPFGLLLCFLLDRFLEKRWSKLKIKTKM